MQQIENILGIDWGASEVGVALASRETKLAFPLVTLRNNILLLDRLGELIHQENVQLVVIGIPSHVNRETVEYPGERLGKELRRRFSVEIAYQNEMFTTKMAQQNLIERGVKDVGKHDDVEAARIILQEWLEIHEGDSLLEG